MRVADTHCDTLIPMAQKGIEAFYTERQGGAPHVNAAAALAGGLEFQVMAAFIPDNAESPMQAFMDAAELFGEWVRTGYGVAEAPPQDTAENEPHERLRVLLSVENGSCLMGDPGNVETLHKLGARGIGLCWNGPNELASGVNGEGGLTEAGRLVIAEMERLRMWVDVSHLNDKSFCDAARAAQRPLMASHSNCRAMCGHARNLSDGQIRALIEMNGYMGLCFVPFFLREDVSAESGLEAAAEDIARHALHALSLGGEDILGFGADFDGVGTLPRGIYGAESYPVVIDALAKAGIGGDLMEKIAYGNWARYCAMIMGK